VRYECSSRRLTAAQLGRLFGEVVALNGVARPGLGAGVVLGGGVEVSGPFVQVASQVASKSPARACHSDDPLRDLGATSVLRQAPLGILFSFARAELVSSLALGRGWGDAGRRTRGRVPLPGPAQVSRAPIWARA
jgi:hypothetical protein